MRDAMREPPVKRFELVASVLAASGVGMRGESASVELRIEHHHYRPVADMMAP